MSARDAILEALGTLSLPPAPLAPPGLAVAGTFEDALLAVGGDVLTMAELATLHGKTAVAEGDVPALILEGFELIEDVWAAEIGFSVAEMAITETGSLVLSSGPGKRRLASLAPPHNVVVVRRSTIIATLEEAFAAMPQATTAIVTGPSRTADIEGTLVRGIHGPKRLSVVFVD